MYTTVQKKFMLAAFKVMSAATMVSATMIPASAAAKTNSSTSSTTLEDVTRPVEDLLKNVLNVLIPLVAAVGAIFCVSLGVKYAKAEEPQEREKAKQHLKSAIIGFVLIFVLIVALRIATPYFQKWMEQYSPKK